MLCPIMFFQPTLKQLAFLSNNIPTVTSNYLLPRGIYRLMTTFDEESATGLEQAMQLPEKPTGVFHMMEHIQSVDNVYRLAVYINRVPC